MLLKNFLLSCLFILLFLADFNATALAVDVAPRISDREIIESLAELKAGQKAINQRFAAIDKRFDEQNKSISQRFAAIDKRFDEQNKSINQRFAAIDKRFDEQNKSINQRFAAIDKRFDEQNKSINQRFAAIDKRFDEQNKSINQRFVAIDKRFDEQNKAINKRFDVVNQRLTILSNTMLALFGAMITLIVALFAYIAWDRRTMLKPVAERLECLEVEVFNELQLRHDDGSLLTRLVKLLREQAKNDPKLAAILRNFSLL